VQEAGKDQRLTLTVLSQELTDRDRVLHRPARPAEPRSVGVIEERDRGVCVRAGLDRLVHGHQDNRS
jgi:hypothetical protein